MDEEIAEGSSFVKEEPGIVKTENTESLEFEEDELQTFKIEPEDSEDSEVHTVVLHNIEIQDTDEIPIVLNNLQIDSSDENVIHTSIIKNNFDQRKAREIVLKDGTDGENLHYVIEEAIEYDDSTQSTSELEKTEIEYIFKEESQNTLDSSEHIKEEEIILQKEEQDQEQPESKKESIRTEQENKNGIIQSEDIKKQEKAFECDSCSKRFRSIAALKRHITASHGVKEDGDDPLTLELCICCGEPSASAHTLGDFKCDHCDEKFLQKRFLSRHCSIAHPIDSTYVCCDCSKKFGSKLELMDHMKIHPIKIWKCLKCNRDFSRKYHLDRHIGQTGCMGAVQRVYDCRVCKRCFTRKDNLADHLRGHAGQIKKPKRKYVCGFCEKEFRTVTLLTIHVRRHTGEKPFQCDLCQKTFPAAGAMKRHLRMHTGEKPYECEKCSRTFAAKETLNRHWKTHTGEKPHVCQFCGKAFIQASQLRVHIFHHTGENAYTCPHCSRAFNRKFGLTMHIKYIHEGAKPLSCSEPECDKTFFRKEDVRRHMLCHTGEKAYECNVCFKRFGIKSSLKNHVLTHRKEPPCSCETCGRAFIRKDRLMRHIRARHRDVLEDIVANVEKKRLQQQLLRAAAVDANNKTGLTENFIWNELTLTESIKELLTLLVDEECLLEFGYPDAPVDKVLDFVIKKCGHKPASEEDFDYLGRLRENAKLLFTVVIDDDTVKELLSNRPVDEVIMHVLRLAKKQKT